MKIKSNLSFFALIICCLLWLCIYLGIIKDSTLTDLILIFPLFLIIMVVMCIIDRKKGNLRQIFITGMCVMVVTQLFCSYLLMVNSSWDPGHVFDGAISFVTTGELVNPQYFARYPNNLMLLYILIVLYKITFTIFGSTSIYWGVILNIFAIDLAIIFSVSIAKYIIKEDAYIVGIISLFFAPYYLWTPIVYTDTLSLPVVTGCTLLLFNISKERTKKEDKSYRSRCIQFLEYFLLGILLSIGFYLKGSLIILLIAAIIYLFFKFDFKKFCFSSLSILAGVALVFLLWSGIFKTLLITPQEFYDREFPVTHFIMMGIHDRGVYNNEDVGFTGSFETYEERCQATTDVIIEKIKEYRLVGITTQMFKKATKDGWNYGTYYAERYLGNSEYMPRLYNILHEFILTNGRYHAFFRAFTQGYYLLLFGMAILAYFITLVQHKRNCELMYLEFALTGCCIFFMIWETYPRYMLHFSLIMLILASYVIKFLKDKILEILAKRFQNAYIPEDDEKKDIKI